MITMLRMLFTVIILSLLLNGISNAQDWKEDSGIELNYDLSGIRILNVIYEGFNYEEAIEITDRWKKWGAKVDIAGTLSEQHGERNNPATGKVHDEIPTVLNPDILLKDADYKNYDLIYFPGGEGVAGFLNTNKDMLQEIIDATVKRQKFVAAICHAPYILSASSLLKGHSVTVQGNEFKSGLMKSGAKIVNETFVSDGFFLTGQWPFFETFSASVAEKLLFPQGGGPFEMSEKNVSPVLKGLMDQRNVFIMKPGIISDDTITLMIRHSVNPILPFDFMNNAIIRFIAVKNTELKATLVDKLTEVSKEKYKTENAPVEAIKRLWTLIFNAPAIIFIFNDLTDIKNIPDLKDREYQIRINTMIAGQSVSQLGLAAKEIGYSISVIGGLRSLIAEDEFKKVLDVPADYHLISIVGIGYPLEFMNTAVARPANEYLLIK